MDSLKTPHREAILSAADRVEGNINNIRLEIGRNNTLHHFDGGGHIYTYTSQGLLAAAYYKSPPNPQPKKALQL